MIEAETKLDKLLIIEDELGSRESLRLLFKDAYNVFLAESVDRGLELLESENPDIALLDIRMPGKSGIEGLREIRKIDPLISVVMTTGNGTLETAQQAIRFGANDYLEKPFDLREMEDVVHRNIQRTHLERNRAKVAERLSALNSELVQKLTAKEKMADLGQASSEFVHDLMSPLTVVHGYAELLEGKLGSIKNRLGSDSDETFESLNIISQNMQECCEVAGMWRGLARPREVDSKLRVGQN